MTNIKQLPNAIRFALFVGAVSTAAMGNALAQDQDQDQDSAATLDRIEVTGSRIKRVDVETTSPVTVVTREAIANTGLSTIGDVLRTLNQSDSASLTNLTNDTNANDGTETISLRGLGTSRTLVLVNGRRWLALGGFGVDLTQLPVAMIERVEVLADGASAIYGSDAIAGVVNIILRDSFNGFEADGYYGENTNGDGEVTTYGFTVGHEGERGAAMLSINKVERDPIEAGDRKISETPVFGVPQAFGSAFGEFGIFSVPGVGLRSLNPSFDQSSGQPTPADFVPFGNATRFNFAPENFLLTPSDRLNVFAKAHYDVTDNIRFFSQFSYTQRKSVTRIASVPLLFGFSGPQWQIPIAADNAFNPFGSQINASGFRMTPLGPRTQIQDFDTYFGTVGLEGFVELLDRSFDWDVFYSRGEASNSSKGENFVNLLHMRQGLGSSFFNAAGQAVCGTPDNPTPVIGGVACVPINMFNGVTGWTPAMVEFARATLVEKQDDALRNWGANITGDLVDLPAGPLAFAAGWERRTSDFADQPDSLIAAGLNSTNFREATKGSQGVEEYYVEVNIPALRDLPGFQLLEFSAAWRHSDFDNSGFIGTTKSDRAFETDNFKYSFLWKPFEDVLFRGSYADTFRAPTVSDLFGGGGEGFPGAIDPCTNAGFAGNPFADLTPQQQAACFAQGVPAGGSFQATSQLRGLFGGNPALAPENGQTFTAGLVFNPRWVPGLDISIDWWQINLRNALGSLGANTILNRCIRGFEGIAPGADDFCQFVTRDPAGDVETIRVGSFNLNEARLEGYDLSANYRFNTDNFGSFAFNLASSYTAQARFATSAAGIGSASDSVGRVDSPFGPRWRIRSTFNTSWSYGDFGLVWGMRHFSHLVEDCSGFEGLFDRGISTFQLCSDPDRVTEDGPAARNRLGSVVYHDFTGTWKTPWNGSIRAGIRNAFKKDPPFSVTPFANSFVESYDIPGAFWWVSYNQQF